MLGIVKKNPLAFALALSAHIVLIIVLITEFDWFDTKEEPRKAGVREQVIQASVVDGEALERKKAAELEQIRQAEEKKKKLALQKEREAEAKKRAEEQRRAEEKRQAEAKRKAEQDRKAKEAAQKARLKKQQEEKARQERQAAERKRQAELKKKQEAEAKKKAEDARKAAELEAKRKAEAARKAREAELRASMLAEQQGREADRYAAAIQRRIEAAWLRSDVLPPGLSCSLRIRVVPGGEVISAQITKSSGNAAFDRSAEAAVFKASPLPVPEGDLFERFRDISMEFDPDN